MSRSKARGSNNFWSWQVDAIGGKGLVLSVRDVLEDSMLRSKADIYKYYLEGWRGKVVRSSDSEEIFMPLEGLGANRANMLSSYEISTTWALYLKGRLYRGL